MRRNLGIVSVAARSNSAEQRSRLLYRQHFESNCVHDAENGEIRSDSQRQHKYYNSGKLWRSPERPDSVLKILKEIRQERDTARVATFLLRVFQRPEIETRTVTGRGDAYTRLDVLSRLQLEMSADFFFQLGVDPVSLKQRATP